MGRKITIREIAREAGVSVSTVSRVLNNAPSVNPEKRTRVQATIERLDYRPSMFAQAMVSNRTHEIAVVISDIRNPYFTDLIAQIDVVAREAGYSILLYNTATARSEANVSCKEEERVFSLIDHKGADGVLILGGEIDRIEPATSYIDALNALAASVPTVIVAQPRNDVQAHFLPRDLKQGTLIALQHLLALGHTQIGFVGGSADVVVTRERVQAFRDGMAMYRRDVQDDWIVAGNFYAASGYESMKSLLDLEHRPTACLAINDRVALGAIRALNDAGLSCPEDLALVSCDAFSDGDYANPRLTSVSQDNRQLGTDAVSALIQLIGNSEAAMPEPQAPSLIIRESCGIGGAR